MNISYIYTCMCVGTTVDESLAREFSDVPGMDVTFLDLSVTSLCLDHGDYLGKLHVHLYVLSKGTIN